MKYFITGATGFIGGHIVRQLRKQGHEVRALVRTPSKATELSSLGVELFPGDITECESLRKPMQGMDGVFHIAAWYKIGTRDAAEGERINVEGTRNVLETMKDLGVPKGVYTSSLAVFSDTGGNLVDESYRHDGPWLSEYDRTKWRAHYEVALPMMQMGLPLVIVQPGVVYGPGDTSSVRKAWLNYLNRKLPAVPARTAMCWAHVEDVARAHLLAMEKGKAGETYILAGPRHSLVEVFKMAEEITGVPAPKMTLPPLALKLMSKLAWLAERFVELPEDYRSEALRITAGVTYLGTNARARRELGYAPRELREGLKETFEHEMRLRGMK